MHPHPLCHPQRFSRARSRPSPTPAAPHGDIPTQVVHFSRISKALKLEQCSNGHCIDVPRETAVSFLLEHVSGLFGATGCGSGVGTPSCQINKVMIHTLYLVAMGSAANTRSKRTMKQVMKLKILTCQYTYTSDVSHYL